MCPNEFYGVFRLVERYPYGKVGMCKISKNMPDISSYRFCLMA
jgi:hypothetical protein